jgi:hypothetical protein
MIAKTNRRWYTIVGVYTDNWQKYCDHVFAVDARNAEDITRNSPQLDDDLVIVAVFEGKLKAMDTSAFAATVFERLIPSLGMSWLHDVIDHSTTD